MNEPSLCEMDYESTGINMRRNDLNQKLLISLCSLLVVKVLTFFYFNDYFFLIKFLHFGISDSSNFKFMGRQ